MSQRIIVIDDAPEIIELYQVLLADEGYQTVAFSQAIDDAQELERAQPDLIILDWLFGREPAGMRVLDTLSAHPPTATVPVIICTAAPMLMDVDYLLETRGVEIVSKPFEIETLLTAVRRVLSSQRPSSDFAAA